MLTLLCTTPTVQAGKLQDLLNWSKSTDTKCRELATAYQAHELKPYLTNEQETELKKTIVACIQRKITLIIKAPKTETKVFDTAINESYPALQTFIKK